MTFLRNCAMGIAIGSGAILPGISSGVFCVIFGIYEKLIDSILNFIKYTKKNKIKGNTKQKIFIAEKIKNSEQKVCYNNKVN